MRRAAVLICDDHPMVSQGLKSLLRPGFVSVGIVNDGRNLIDALVRTRPDVLLLDVSMPHINGLELLPQVREAAPALKIIIVTMHVDRALADLAVSAGAHGFIPKEASADELNAAIEHVLSETRPFISPRIPRRSFRDKAAVEHPELDRLTPRHRQILRMIGDGKSSQEMADLLGVSPRTIEFHRASIRKALGITTEWGLLRFAIMMRASEGDDSADEAAVGEPPPASQPD
jgi:DNA-binding NarL/FixJ family response regulator